MRLTKRAYVSYMCIFYTLYTLKLQSENLAFLPLHSDTLNLKENKILIHIFIQTLRGKCVSFILDLQHFIRKLDSKNKSYLMQGFPVYFLRACA